MTYKSDFSKAIELSVFTMSWLKEITPGLTYRQVGSWDAQGLVKHDRLTATTGWRRFSVKDAVALQVVSDLRRFGLPVLNIKQCLDSLKSDFTESVHRSIKKERIFILLRAGGKARFFVSNAQAEPHFVNEYAAEPVLLLPFHKYVNRLNEVKYESAVQDLIQGIFSADPFTLAQTVRQLQNSDYVIKKPDGGAFIVECKSPSLGPQRKEKAQKLGKVQSVEKFINLNIFLIEGSNIQKA